MALALYRKYRPATFAEVIGQEHVTDPLRIALGAGRVNHAYLFSGPRGCGKTSSARILARSLNCAKGPTPDPCGECNSCVGLAPNGPGSVDVVELDAASHGGVDDTRELREKAFYAPAEAKYRVFIIDEAHMVTTQGFNALLKIVEEPPEHLIFIFATTEPDKVLPTIRSRTHHYPFRLIPPVSMRALLERNCAAEGVAVEPSVFPLVIRAGGGSARDTQSVMDQLLSGAGPEGVRYDRAIALLGVTDVALIDDVVEGLAAGDGSAVFGTVDRLVDAGHDPRRFATDLLDRLRDLVLLCAVPDAGERGLVSAPEDVLAKMIPQAQNIGPATLTRYAEVLHQGLTDMRGATAPRLLLELLCARMLLPSVSDAESAVLQRVERLEKHGVAAGGGNGGGGAPAVESKFQRPSQRQAEPEPAPAQAAPQAVAPPVAATQIAAPPVVAPPAAAQPVAAPAEPTPQPATPQQPAAQARPTAQAAPQQARFQRPSQSPPQPASAAAEPAAPAAAPASGAVDAVEIRRRWPELLGVVKGASRSTEAMLTNATVAEVDGTSVTLTHTSGPLARRLAEQRNAEVIAKAFGQVLGGSWQVRCVQGDAATAQRPQQQARQARPAPARPSQAESAPAPGHGRQMLEKAMQAQANRSTGRAGDDIPLPPEPDEPDDPLPPEPVDEEEMFAEAARPGEPGEERLDPEAVVLKLLADELGARPLKS
ncbi:DNA polymerase III subunit gamma and tau [Actinosynnema pretiosum subsp. pretiosum]|uniref:DNA polymerase III subunit gamma/tau n=1 Tax=Actinosynnema pretiosum subsp. pretiosum TaxID=103721 RepID=A0AA45R7F4_9PSEU|nr:DNA polymerase III subunits gamma and tau [Actinosynnema pretiosum subsp. pretiosum]QUF08042.1 DNA polymerase III subunit gamma and tau [Actinosynnema pretiosum subsp. pretiosum]